MAGGMIGARAASSGAAPLRKKPNTRPRPQPNTIGLSCERPAD